MDDVVLPQTSAGSMRNHRAYLKMLHYSVTMQSNATKIQNLKYCATIVLPNIGIVANVKLTSNSLP